MDACLARCATAAVRRRDDGRGGASVADGEKHQPDMKRSSQDSTGERQGESAFAAQATGALAFPHAEEPCARARAPRIHQPQNHIKHHLVCHTDARASATRDASRLHSPPPLPRYPAIALCCSARGHARVSVPATGRLCRAFHDPASDTSSDRQVSPAGNS